MKVETPSLGKNPTVNVHVCARPWQQVRARQEQTSGAAVIIESTGTWRLGRAD